MTQRKGVEIETGNKKLLGKETIKAYLECKFGQYNCGVKTVGRLELKMEPTKYVEKLGTLLDVNKDRIIAEFAHWISLSSSHKELSTGNEFFPYDSGVYPPGVLLYADHCGYISQNPNWWTSFQALIHELETNPAHGWQVFKSPIFSNFYYRTGDGKNSHPSRVWMMVPPYAVGTLALFNPKKFAKAKTWEDTFYPEDIADMVNPTLELSSQTLKVAAATKAAGK